MAISIASGEEACSLLQARVVHGGQREHLLFLGAPEGQGLVILVVLLGSVAVGLFVCYVGSWFLSGRQDEGYAPRGSTERVQPDQGVSQSKPRFHPLPSRPVATFLPMPRREEVGTHRVSVASSSAGSAVSGTGTARWATEVEPGFQALFPELVHNDRAMQLSVPMRELLAASSHSGSHEVIVSDTAGDSLFMALACPAPGGRALVIMAPRLWPGAPLAVVKPTFLADALVGAARVSPLGETSPEQAFEVAGPDGATYGFMLAAGGGLHAFQTRSAAALTIQSGRQGKFHLMAVTASGRVAASALPTPTPCDPSGHAQGVGDSVVDPCGLNQNRGGMVQQLALRVEAGADLVLVLACMLAVVLLFDHASVGLPLAELRAALERTVTMPEDSPTFSPTHSASGTAGAGSPFGKLPYVPEDDLVLDD